MTTPGPGGHGEGDGRARLFVALSLEAEVSARLLAWARETVGRGTGERAVRLLDADALHLTLCFLGMVDLAAADAIRWALADVVRTSVDGPLVFEPADVLWLPARRPRVCAVSLRDRGGRASALQTALSGRLSEGGWYAPERRRWLAHVTVARLSRDGSAVEPGRVTEVGRVVEHEGALKDGRLTALVLDPFPATAVTLMRSWPGSRYETLARIAL